jgi:inosose dehydratase
MTRPADLSRLRLGTAPDSWGVWFPEDDHQVTWRQYLDELPKAGYVWTELGPQGFLPQDPRRLRDELEQRGLMVCGGTVFAALHRGAEALKKAIDDFGREAKRLSALGARHLIHLPEQYTDMHTGAATDAAPLNADHWTNLVNGTNELGRVISEEYGVELVFHPHVDTHVEAQEEVERFLDDTDPRYVNLCLDTGHIAYAGGNNVEIVRRYPQRINYVHLKQVDPVVREHVRRHNLPLSEAVKLGAMVEPPHGEPPMPPLLEALAGLDKDLFCVIEQDLYPVEPDVPLPIAARAAGYYVACGLGPVRHWPYQPVQLEEG